MPLYSAGHNQPGYLPDNGPLVVTRHWQRARDALVEELGAAADTAETCADPHDCDDLPCPTYGDDCPDHLAADLRAAAEELAALDPATPWLAHLGREAWWLEDLGDHCPECGFVPAERGWPASHQRPGDGQPCGLQLDDEL